MLWYGFAMPDFSPSLFWDCDPMTIDLDRHAGFLVGRVLTRGVLNDWRVLREIYGLERIAAEARKLRDLDPRTLAFCCAYFDLPRDQFRCVSNEKSLSPAPAIS